MDNVHARCEYCGRTFGEDHDDCFAPGSKSCLIEMCERFAKAIKTGISDEVDVGWLIADFNRKLKLLKQRS